jgi:hypothetical protein
MIHFTSKNTVRYLCVGQGNINISFLSHLFLHRTVQDSESKMPVQVIPLDFSYLGTNSRRFTNVLTFRLLEIP